MPFDLEAVRDLFTFVIAGIAVVSAVYVSRNMAVINNYKATVESQEKRIEALERDNFELKAEVERLKGREEGHQLAAKLWVEAVALAGLCAKEDCDHRVLPRPTSIQRGM